MDQWEEYFVCGSESEAVALEDSLRHREWPYAQETELMWESDEGQPIWIVRAVWYGPFDL